MSQLFALYPLVESIRRSVGNNIKLVELLNVLKIIVSKSNIIYLINNISKYISKVLWYI